MAERNPSDDQAAFGVFPQLKRNRSKQDREAAKNVPVDLARGALAGVLGAPGDIESLVRMLPYIDEKTILPTSEDIEKKLPFRSDTPVSRAATGLGTLGGGFYYGPGAPLRVAGALPKAIKHGAEEFAKASVAGVPHVIKPKGGNWLSGGVEKQLGRLKMADKMNPEWYADRERWLDEAIAKGDERAVRAIKEDVEVGRRNDAISNWIDSNLTNYVKKDMATPEDPVRKLAEQGVLHIQPYGDQYEVSRRLMNKRSGAGFPPLGMGKNEPARFWERQADISVEPYPAGSYKHGALDESILTDNPWLQNVSDETMVNYAKGLNDLGFDHIIDVLRQDVREGRIRPEQLNKVSMEQAVRRTHEFDQEMARKMREAAIKNQEGFPVHKEYPEGYKWIELAPSKELPEGWTEKNGAYYSPEGQRQVHPSSEKLADALKYEGNTMGHCVGGYCPDVLEGRSRIFSLRDAKGEPHVTVEVRPTKGHDKYYTDWFRSQPENIQDEITASAIEYNAKNPDLGYGQSFNKILENRIGPVPEEIIQIKGKQNAKPKNEYLPYVQDFVKSGKWSDVGDFHNTGLRRTSDVFNETEQAFLKSKGVELKPYIEPEENARYQELFKRTPDAPTEGMKRGGVAISHNPDTMMLELNDRKMAGGGLTKLLKGAKEAVKAEPEIMKASEALGKIEGRPLVITQADRTKVGEGYLGGPGFSSLQLTEPEYRAAEAAWGVKTPGVAKMILGGAKKAGDKPVFTTMIGSPTQHQSNQMVFDKLYGDFKKAAKKGGLPTELRDKINDRLVRAVDKEGNPVFPADIDILDKKFRDIANTFDRRSIAGHLMGGVQVGGKKGQIIDYDKIIRETTDPALIDVPSGSLGNRLFTLSGGIIDRPDLHPAFPTILQGEDLGLQFSPVAKDILMRDFIEKTMREKGRKPGYMDFTRGHPPSQLITEDILTEMQKLGLKEGGEVKKPAAKIDGNEFVLAAQKYGIKDSMNNLNKIVDLVNKGLSVDDAARQVADTGMHKAAGGAITGDDLIIEERPL